MISHSPGANERLVDTESSHRTVAAWAGKNDPAKRVTIALDEGPFSGVLPKPWAECKKYSPVTRGGRQDAAFTKKIRTNVENVDDCHTVPASLLDSRYRASCTRR